MLFTTKTFMFSDFLGLENCGGKGTGVAGLVLPVAQCLRP